jgi:tetraacyldisaccharide 4'-kinase
VQKLIVPDHYMFSRNEIEKIVNKAKDDNLEIIMTEKDYYKVKHFGFNKFGYLKVSLIIKKKEEFLNKIKEIYV